MHACGLGWPPKNQLPSWRPHTITRSTLGVAMDMKSCAKCRELKPHSEFHKSSKHRCGLKSSCKDCRRSEDPGASARARKYYLENKVKVLANVKDYAKRRPEIAIAAQKKWIAKNGYVYQGIWSKNNPGKVNAGTAKRRKSARKATPSWADSSAMDLIYIKARALTDETGVSYHVDHIVPLQGKTVCGLHCEANLQVIPAAENLAKFNVHWPDMP